VNANQLTSLEPLAQLDRVTWANVAANEIETLAPLLDGSFRGTLVVSGNPLACESEAANFTTLRSLGMDVRGSCEP